MRQRPNHTMQGMMFLGICVLIAAVLFLAIRSHTPAAAPVPGIDVGTTNRSPSGNETWPAGTPGVVDTDQGAGAPNADVLTQLGVRQGQAYAQVRQTLAQLSYAPAQFNPRDCSPYGTARGRECFDRPEVLNCSGVADGYCVAYWVRSDSVLQVTLREGPNGVLDAIEVETPEQFVGGLNQDNVSLVGPAVRILGVTTTPAPQAGGRQSSAPNAPPPDNAGIIVDNIDAVPN